MNKRCFIFVIEIEQNAYDFKCGEVTYIPIISNNRYNAERKFNTNNCGSQFPNFRVMTIKESKHPFWSNIIDE